MRIWKEIWDYAKMIIIVVVIVTLVNSVVLINAKIPSESMEKNHYDRRPYFRISPCIWTQSGFLRT